MKRRVIIQKVDMDTALTAFLLGVSEQDEIIVVRDKASPEDLADPNVICIECGGSRQIHLANFDHHNTKQELPAACVQAWEFRFLYRYSDRWATHEEKREHSMNWLQLQLESLCPDLHYGSETWETWFFLPFLILCLLDYVSLLDTQGPEALKASSQLPEGAFPTLSDVFSGMLLITKDPKEQLLKGIGIYRTVLQEGLHPFELMPELAEWKEYIEAKRQNNEAIQKAIANAQFFETRSGLKAGFVETDVIGALGALYKLGCQIAIAYSPQFGNPPVPKYTIAGNSVRVDNLLPILDEKEDGWGGPAHGTIIGSPRAGSKLQPAEVIKIVQRYL